jgi:hypothetical protein
MVDMSETPQSEPETGPIDPVAPHAAPVATAPVPTVVERRHGRLNKVAAWIGVVAGTVFIVGAIFFSGFFMGLVAGHGGGHHGHHGGGGQSEWHHHHGGPDGFQGRPGPGWPGGFPGGFGGPGGFGPGGPGGPDQGPNSAPTPPGR